MSLRSKCRVSSLRVKALLLNECPKHDIRELYTAKVCDDTRNIPNVVYQTWDTPYVGRTHLKWLKKFRELNPSYSFVFFDTKSIHQFMEENYTGHPILDIFKKIKFGASMVDVFRYCLLLKNGGWYFDINKMVNVALDELSCPCDTAVLAFENNKTCNYFGERVPETLTGLLQCPHNTFVQWGFGFQRAHPILQQVLDNIVKAYPDYKGKRVSNVADSILNFTATYQWTKTIWQVMELQPSLNIHQCGIDYYRQGVFNIPRSWSRYLRKRSYVDYHDCVIVE